ncbi:preprotein translocase subunit SecG [Candidatus Peregrinibacteria bacterium]|jgi:protein translocase SecG subunit|nr:preprotein translocase subunit SecG [Candidatus Peregrinibacteria bacterium]
MESTLIILQSIFAILFMLSVLFQEKGSGMSLTFGGGENNDTFYGSKQGIDKLLNQASYVLGTLFVLNALLYVVLT